MYDITCTDINGNPIEYFTQWDVGQKIYIRDLKLSEAPLVHFTNVNRTNALTVNDATLENGVLVVKVPNELLAEPYRIIVYLYEYDLDTRVGKTIHTGKIEIRRKTKPDDYIYKETVAGINIVALDARVRTLMNREKEISSDITSLKSRTDNLESRLSSANLQISDHTRRITNIENVEIPNLKAADTNLDNRISQETQRIDGEIQNLTEKDSAIESDISSINENIEQLQSTDSGLSDRISALETDNESNKNSISENTDAISNLSSSLSSLESSVTSEVQRIDGEISQLQSADSALDGRITALESDNTNNKNAISENSNSIAELSSSINSLSETVASETSRIDSEISDVKTDINDNTTQISELKGDLVELNKGIFVKGKIRKSYVDSTNGEIKEYSADTNPFCRTDYIDLSDFTKLIINNPNNRSLYNCFYDSNKNYISSFVCEIGENKILVPENAKYFIISNNESSFDTETIYGFVKQYHDYAISEIEKINSNFVETEKILTGTRKYNNYIAFDWIKGHKYKVTNNSSDTSIDVAIYTSNKNDTTGDIDTISARLRYGESVEFVCTTNAQSTRLYCTDAGGSVAILDEDTLIGKVNRTILNPYSDRPTSGYENFSVKVNYSEYTNNSSDTKLEYDDYGVIALPTSYKKDGEKTKLIIFCQGTGERIGQNTNPLSNYGWNYFLSKGYAVLDMNGMSSAWGNSKGFPVTNQHYCNKFLLTSYAKGYEYVIKKYNLDTRVFVAGISMGGGASALIVQSKILPVIAHACFCPALSVYKQDYMNPWGGENQQKTIAGQWGFTDWETTTPSKEYFLANYDKVKGFDNLLIGTIGNHTEANANYGNEAEANAYNSMSKIYPVPLKIWHCIDDTTVLERYSEFMVNMIKNAGGQAWLRTFETGGHIGGWNSGTVEDGGVSTSIPFYEAIMFFERFR